MDQNVALYWSTSAYENLSEHEKNSDWWEFHYVGSKFLSDFCTTEKRYLIALNYSVPSDQHSASSLHLPLANAGLVGSFKLYHVRVGETHAQVVVLGLLIGISKHSVRHSVSKGHMTGEVSLVWPSLDFLCCLLKPLHFFFFLKMSFILVKFIVINLSGIPLIPANSAINTFYYTGETVLHSTTDRFEWPDNSIYADYKYYCQ